MCLSLVAAQNLQIDRHFGSNLALYEEICGSATIGVSPLLCVVLIASRELCKLISPRICLITRLGFSHIITPLSVSPADQSSTANLDTQLRSPLSLLIFRRSSHHNPFQQLPYGCTVRSSFSLGTSRSIEDSDQETLIFFYRRWWHAYSLPRLFPWRDRNQNFINLFTRGYTVCQGSKYYIFAILASPHLKRSIRQ